MRSGVLFDLDETLIDRRGTLFSYAARLYSELEDEIVIDKVKFLALVGELDGYGKTPRHQFFESLAGRAFVGESPRTLQQRFFDHAWLSPRPLPGVARALAEIKARGLPLGIVTNGRRSVQTAKIQNSGLAEYFDAVVISEEFGTRKPDPAIFQHAAGRLGIDAESSWFVGDDPIADIEGASDLGFRTAWLERHLPWPVDRPPCYEVRASRISDLLDVLPGGG